MSEHTLHIDPSLAYWLPSMVREELAKLSAHKQEEFMIEYKKKEKSLPLAYLFLFVICAAHYAYMNRWWMQLLYRLTGAGLGIWAIVDIFRMPSLVRRYNDQKALEILQRVQTSH